MFRTRLSDTKSLCWRSANFRRFQNDKADYVVELDHGAYLEDLALQGYTVDVVAADGYSVSFESARISRDNGILVAHLVNENPLQEKHFPLRVIGTDLQKNEQAGQVAQIVSHLPGVEAEAPPEAAEPPAPEAPAGDAALAIVGMV